MNTQHTPGPWDYACDSYHSTPCLGKVRHSKKAVVYNSALNKTIASHVANWDDARLIAAAPELLAALRECITEDGAAGLQEGLGRMRRRILAINDIARNAIAKALGQQIPIPQVSDNLNQPI